MTPRSFSMNFPKKWLTKRDSKPNITGLPKTKKKKTTKVMTKTCLYRRVSKKKKKRKKHPNAHAQT